MLIKISIFPLKFFIFFKKFFLFFKKVKFIIFRLFARFLSSPKEILNLSKFEINLDLVLILQSWQHDPSWTHSKNPDYPFKHKNFNFFIIIRTFFSSFVRCSSISESLTWNPLDWRSFRLLKRCLYSSFFPWKI